MGRWSGLLLLLLVLSGLVAYLWLVERPREQADREALGQADRLLAVDPMQATALTLINGPITIRLRKDQAGAWRLTEPVAAPADHVEVQRLLTQAAMARRERVIDDAADGLAAFGLERSPMTVEFTVDGLEHRIEFGDRNPSGASIYARVFPALTEPSGALSSPVLLVAAPVRDAIEKTPFDLRKKELLDFLPTEVTEIGLRYADRRRPITLTRHPEASTGPAGTGGWKLSAPIQTGADQAEAEALLRQLGELRATAIFDEGRSAKLAGLMQPRTEVTLAAGDRAITRIGFYFPFAEEAAYAVTAPDGPLYQIDRQTVLQFDKTLFDLRDKRLVAVRPEVVERVTVSGPDGAHQLTRQGAMAWQWDGQPLSGPGNEQVEAFLDALDEARIEKMAGQTKAAWPSLGLGPTATAVTLTGREAAGSQGPVVVRLGKTEGELLYVRRGNEPESYITQAALLDRLPTTEKLRTFLMGSDPPLPK